MAEQFTQIRWIKALRILSRLAPLQHRLFPLVRSYSETRGLLVVPWGDHKLCFPSDWPLFVQSGLIFDGRNINPEFLLLGEIIPELSDGLIVDVGAHIGCYVLEIRTHSKLPIVAYEPAPAIVDLLKANVMMNDLKDIEIRGVACGDQRGLISLDADVVSSVSRPTQTESAVPNGARPKSQTQVPIVTLDEELNDVPRVSLLKIDCEGFEYHVLSGAREILKRHRPHLLIELHPRYIEKYGFTGEDLCELLRPLYNLEFYDFNLSRKRGRLMRVLGRYVPSEHHRFASEAEMFSEISKEPIPDQIFIVGRARHDDPTVNKSSL